MKLNNLLFLILFPLFTSQISGNYIDTNIPDSLKVAEKVYLQTDRCSYFSGDDIWFKAYLIDATNMLLTSHSNNLHVELISPASKIIMSRLIRIDDGSGNGDFQLPEKIQSGRYHLRAYTNYMRNFNDRLFFKKEIIIINSLDSLDNLHGNIEFVKNNIDINFFPEGGSLVDNVSSFVAFKAVDANGKGCDVSGNIYSSTGELITELKSVHLGMGSFFLRPVPGMSYYAIIKNPGSADIKTEIPKSLPSGITLSVSFIQNGKLQIAVKTNPQNLSLVLDHDFLLSFSARKTIFKTIRFKMKSFSNSFTVPVDDLPDGIAMLTLSTPEDLPLSERMIFIQKHNDLKVNIVPDKIEYKQRDSVSVKLSLNGDSLSMRTALLSFAAAEKNFTDNSSLFPSTISSWFLLESDVRGPVEEPSYYFDPSNPDRLRDIDLLLRTQGWRDFVWKYKNVNSFVPENGFTISGRLTKSFSKKPLDDARVNIGIFGSSNNFFTIVNADSSGKFRLDGLNFTGDARLIASAIGNKNQLQGKLFLDSLGYKPAGIPDSLYIEKVILKENLNELKQEYKINEAIRKKYKLSDTINPGEVTIIAKKPQDLKTIRLNNSRRLYETPDKEIIVTPQLENYSSVVELLRGRVAGVQVSGDLLTGDYKITMRGSGSIELDTNPIVLIDGIKGSFDDLINLPLFIIDRIDVIKPGGKSAIFGMEGSNGVISIITKTTDQTAGNNASHSINRKITGYDAARIFYSPVHSPRLEQSYQPDQRITLFWKPYIRLTNNKDVLIKYFNADKSSTIRVIVEGITTDGIPLTGKIEYNIK